MKRTPTRVRSTTLLAAGFLSVHVAAPVLRADTYDVNLSSAQFTLYTDPYNGNGIKLGGFSGLYPVPGKPNSFYTVTDRGPAPDFIDGGGVLRKTWAIPEFGPHLVTLRLLPNGTAKVDDMKPLRRLDGTPITGLPPSIPAGDVPFDFNLQPLPFDEDSLDVEGITMDPWGNFWICEEYKPSVALMLRDGRVLFRLVPAGTMTGTEEIPTIECLPSVFAKRRNNRGFEGLAISRDWMLYTIFQRPLNNPNQTAANANGNVRLVAVDLKVLLGLCDGPLVRQYVYRVPAPTPNTVSLSDLFALGDGKLLASERVTNAVFEVNLAGATDITPLEDATGKLIADPTQTLEQLDTAELAAFGITPVTKTVVLGSLTSIDPLLEKIEGLCVSRGKLVMAYDNDFNVAETASIPADPFLEGPFVELDLVGANYPKIFTVPMP